MVRFAFTSPRVAEEAERADARSQATGNTVERTWVQANPPTGVDDTAHLLALIALMAAAEPAPLAIRLCRGVYRYTSNLVIPDYCAIAGQGHGTVLRPSAAVTQALALGTLSSVRDLDIDGQDTSGKLGLVLGASTIKSGSQAERVTVQSFTGANAAGIKLRASVGARLVSVTSYGNRVGFITDGTVDSTPTTADLIGCLLQGNVEQGALLDIGWSLTFRGCRFQGNGAEGLLAQPSAEALIGILLDHGCWFESNWAGAADPPSHFSFWADGSSGTCRISLKETYFNTTALSEKAARLTATTPALLDNIRTGSAAYAGHVTLDGNAEAYWHAPWHQELAAVEAGSSLLVPSYDTITNQAP